MEQLSSMQQSVRTAFEYLSSDARMVGHLGCFTRRDTGFTG
jgi:type IV pilus assembly protein PilW